MDLSFLYVVGLVLVMGVFAMIGHRFRWTTIDYMRQKIHDPTLPPPKTIKFANRIIRYLVLFAVIGPGVFMLYDFASRGQLIASGIVAVFIVLAITTIVLVSSYWKDNFDL